jgi:hypothetical protein
MRTSLAIVIIAVSACTFDPGPSAPAGDDDTGSVDPSATTPPPDDSPPDVTPPVDDGYVPKALTATRFGVFYQISGDVLDTYQDPDHGLPQIANHAWLITHSHAVAFASRTLADHVHLRDDFYYAPAFDVWDASHKGWETASDTTLAMWAHDFRDAAIAAHADLFTFNEAPSATGADDNVRIQIAKILRYLHEPDPQGRVLWGVVYLTEAAATPANYDSSAPDFFAAIDATSVALVAEHYHSNGFICGLSEDALAAHYFALRAWLVASGDPAKLDLANSKFTVLHSARYSDGASGWSGADSSKTTLADFQRALSRVSKVTRETAGGLNRLSFGPTTTGLTDTRVEPRITALYRWHYLHTAAMDEELPCIANDGGNCSCN